MDELSLSTLFLALAAILIFSGFFSSSETGMMALNRHRLNHLARKGNKRAKLTEKLLAQTDRLLGSVLFGNTLLNVAAAAITQIIVLKVFGKSDWWVLISTLAISFVILVVSEIMPKIIAASYPERTALLASYPLTLMVKLFHPVVWIATNIVHYLLWLFRIKVQTDQSQSKLSMDELRMLVLESEQFLPRKHQGMLLNLVDIGRAAINNVMVPRNQIESLDLNVEPERLREQLMTCHHTLLPVCEGGLDNIVGILHARRVLMLMRRAEFDADDLRALLNEPYFIPSDTSLLSQLQHFQERHARLGLVVDEYGELLGLVTLENILEEIVGDFTTQSPTQSGKFSRQEDGSLLVEGSTPLRDLNRKLGLHFPLGEAKTLNGLILEHMRDIPEAGTSVKIAGHPIEIIQTQDRVVKMVKIFPATPRRGE